MLSKVSFQHFRLIYEICCFVVPAFKYILVLSPHVWLVALSFKMLWSLPLGCYLEVNK